MLRRAPTSLLIITLAIAVIAPSAGAGQRTAAFAGEQDAGGEAANRTDAEAESSVSTEPSLRPPPPQDGLFTAHVRPILNRHCLRCHGAIRRRADLDLRTVESLLAGGESGAAVIEGDPDASRLWRVVQSGADPHMPPDGQLDEDELAILRIWIEGRGSARDSREPSTGTAGAELSETSHLFPSRLPSPPAGVAPRLVVDLLLEAAWHRDGVTPSAPAGDREFARRVTLDLIGRVPATDEMEAFLSETNSDKRERLVDRLLSSPEHARHLGEVFTVVLFGRAEENRSGRRRRGDAGDREKREAAWEEWIEASFAENRPWNSIARELILARPEDERDRAAVAYLYERRNDHARMAADTAASLFGLRIECAQCHDHPLAPEILQSHYWGLVAFFNRSENVATKRGPGVAESAIGGFGKFADIRGKETEDRLLFFDGSLVEETRPPPDTKPEDSPDLYLVPKSENPERAAVPKFSRRARLAEIALERTEFVERAFVNRLWALVFGRGLVHPVDRMDSAHAPDHPELLAWLARDFRASGFDVRRLVRELVLTRAYALESLPAADAALPPDASFARALEKPLSAEVLWRSLVVATGNERREDEMAPPRDLVARFPTVFHETYTASLAQALYLTNNADIEALLAPREENLSARLLAVEDANEAARLAFAGVLAREPEVEELARASEYLAARADRPDAARRQLLWALLTSPEFLFNH